jgi:hypothetical protein
VEYYLLLFFSFIILSGEIGWDGRDWIELAQDRDQ